MDYVGQTFRDCRVELDGNTFSGCYFDNVVLDYGGGETRIEGCAFDGFRFAPSGNLLRGLNTMRALAQQGGAKTVDPLADGLAAFIRTPDPTSTVTLG